MEPCFQRKQPPDRPPGDPEGEASEPKKVKATRSDFSDPMLPESNERLHNEMEARTGETSKTMETEEGIIKTQDMDTDERTTCLQKVPTMPYKVWLRVLMEWQMVMWIYGIPDFELIDLYNNYYVVRFTNLQQKKAQYKRVLFEGPWVVMQHCVLVQRWSPYFDPFNNPLG
ncbi:uncharacterized protein LOC129294555 [Prosopis cineraria]|uniref:uncharacterized protein LOC129294555 n=1 Tax=Prosopis cineraria TaxID=364024 RepID=UPI00240F8284|nr:uncharacterized protein LOC129294555 [Prosopis cineraria]